MFAIEKNNKIQAYISKNVINLKLVSPLSVRRNSPCPKNQQLINQTQLSETKHLKKVKNQILLNKSNIYQNPYKIFNENILITLNQLKKSMKNSKIGWTDQSQSFLKLIVQSEKLKNWKTISFLLNKKFPTKTKTAKQCRERYVNYIKCQNVALVPLNWTQSQYEILFENYARLGSKWAQISKLLPGKSENNIKNRFYGSVRKLVRKINAVKKKQRMKHTKLIKERGIIKILEKGTLNSQKKLNEANCSSQKFQKINQIKNEILFLLKDPFNEQQDNKIVSLISKIQKCKKTRPLNRNVIKLDCPRQEVQISEEKIMKQIDEELFIQFLNTKSVNKENVEIGKKIDLKNLCSFDSTVDNEDQSFAVKIHKYLEISCSDIIDELLGLQNQFDHYIF